MNMNEEEFDNKYYNDVILYKTIQQFDSIKSLKDSKREAVIILLKQLSDFYSEELEHEKMYFVNKLAEYVELNYYRSFEETFIIQEESNDIIKMLEEEYGGPLFE